MSHEQGNASPVREVPSDHCNACPRCAYARWLCRLVRVFLRDQKMLPAGTTNENTCWHHGGYLHTPSPINRDITDTMVPIPVRIRLPIARIINHFSDMLRFSSIRDTWRRVSSPSMAAIIAGTVCFFPSLMIRSEARNADTSPNCESSRRSNEPSANADSTEPRSVYGCMVVLVPNDPSSATR